MRILQIGILACVAVSAACSSSSDNNNNNNNPVPEIDAGITPVVDAAAIEDAVAQHEAAPAAATFTQVYTDIISPICVQCHNPNGIGVSLGHLDMSTKAVAFMDLVGVSAMGSACGGMGTRVVAGNANSSILFKKVDPAQASPCGSKMPLGLTPLTEAQTAEIEGWINAGAMNN